MGLVADIISQKNGEWYGHVIRGDENSCGRIGLTMDKVDLRVSRLDSEQIYD